MSEQLTLDFGPTPFRFLYVEAANDPVYDATIYRRASELRTQWRSIDRRAHFRRLYAEQGGCCDDCPVRLSRRGSEIDHRVALINGGDNSPDNLRLLCLPCHALKTSRDMYLYRRRRQLTPTLSGSIRGSTALRPDDARAARQLDQFRAGLAD